MSNNLPSIADTIDRIKQFHAGQFDHTGEEYWRHPVAVMNLLPSHTSHETRLAALLHDVLEDTDVTADDLRGLGYSDEVLETVELVTRRPEKGTYLHWISSIALSGNVGAMQVKYADNQHNSDPGRIERIKDESKREAARSMAEGRYRRSMDILYEGIIETVVARAIKDISPRHVDDYTLDGTDFAHPAWWRGNDAGVAAVVKIIAGVLDGDESSTTFGTYGSRELTNLVARIAGLRQHK